MHVVILAGGSGTRLWPMSRPSRPKQFLRLAGDRSLLQATVDRIRPIVPIDRVLVVTDQSQAPLVVEELPDLPVENILGEPTARGTASALGLATRWIAHKAGPEEVMISLHSDHLIGDADLFRSTLRAAAALAAKGSHLVTLGIRPTEPATSFGYIRVGDPLDEVDSFTVHRVDQFVEKPNRARAEEYLVTGRYLWNSGLFVWRVDAFLQQVSEHLPETFQKLESLAAYIGTPGWADALRQGYPTIPNQTVDVGIMERAGNVAVIPSTFPWSDVGSWSELLDVLPRNDDGNVVRGTHVGLDTHDCLVFAGTKPIATIGLSDLVIVETPDVVLVCPRDRAQDVKKIVERLGADDALRQLVK